MLPYMAFGDLTNCYSSLFLRHLHEDRLRGQIILESFDGGVFEIDKRAAASGSGFIADHLRYAPDTQRIVLPTICGDVLRAIVNYLRMQYTEGFYFWRLDNWLAEFLEEHRAILPDLHTAAGYLRIQRLCDLTTEDWGEMPTDDRGISFRIVRGLKLKWELCDFGCDSVIKKLYEHFSCASMNESFHNRLITKMLFARASGEFDKDTCDRFEGWLGRSHAGTLPYMKFRELTNYNNFLFLCYCLYKGRFRLHQEQIIVESSDEVIFKIDKPVAAVGSDFFAGHLRFAPNTQRIVLPTVRGDVLIAIVNYLQMSYYFREVSESAVRPFKGWVTEFLKEHRAILPELHTAAVYLGIRSLCDLTRQALRDLRGRNALDELTECGLSSSHLFQVMDFDRKLELEWELDHFGRDSVSTKLYGYFGCAGMSKSFHNRLIAEMLNARASGDFGEDTCDRFEGWLGRSEGGTLPYMEFRDLTNSPDFLFLCYCLYTDQFRLHQDQILLESSDGRVFKIEKCVAAAGSGLFAYLLYREPDTRVIQLSTIRSDALSAIGRYLRVSYDFREVSEPAVRPFKDWVTEFLKEHRAILGELHTAADFLLIWGMSDLTSQALRDPMGRNTLEEPSWILLSCTS